MSNPHCFLPPLPRHQLKAQISMFREGCDALVYDLAEQALGSEEILTTSDLFKYVDCINTSDVANVSPAASVSTLRPLPPSLGLESAK